MENGKVVFTGKVSDENHGSSSEISKDVCDKHFSHKLKDQLGDFEKVIRRS